MTKEDDYYMLVAMREMGGSFIQQLAALLWSADSTNYAKLERAFPEYFAEYRDWGKKLQQQNHDN